MDWTSVAPGEYEVVLTVKSSKGLTSTDEVKVHVNYAGTWTDFEMEETVPPGLRSLILTSRWSTTGTAATPSAKPSRS